MASAAAHEQPTIERSWQACVAHLPTLLLIWLVSSLISGLGLLVMLTIKTTALAQLAQVPFSILAGLVGVLFTAVPALHYATGQVIGVEQAFGELMRRPGRYLLAGALFAAATTVGTLLCVLPGIAVALVMPVYVNLIFTGDRPIADAFQAAFHACYGTAEGRSFLLVELITWLVVVSVTVCTCLVGGLVVGPMANFYLQNVAYQRGVLR